MANTKSAKKRARQNPKRRARNFNVRSGLRTAVKAAKESIVAKKPSPETMKSAISTIAKAANKGVIHRRNAARKISRLMKMAKKATTTASATK